MSIATAITAAQGKVANAYTAVSTKGGTLPATQNLSNLPTAISSIPTGTTPTGTLSITANGVYDVTTYASADVSVSGGGGGGIGIPREVSQSGVYQMPSSNFTFSLPSNATDVGNYALYHAFYECTALTSVDLSSLTTISGTSGFYEAFSNCSSLTSVDLSSLTTVSGTTSLVYAFQDCTALTSVDLSSLTTVSGISGFYYAFYGCRNLTSISFPALTTISGMSGFSYAFQSCTSLTSISFPMLNVVSGSQAFSRSFASCTSLTSISFPALTTSSFGSLTNQFNYMLSSTGTTVTHTIHFPSNLQSKISTLSGYPNFGGTSGYVTLAFDLPATS